MRTYRLENIDHMVAFHFMEDKEADAQKASPGSSTTPLSAKPYSTDDRLTQSIIDRAAVLGWFIQVHQMGNEYDAVLMRKDEASKPLRFPYPTRARAVCVAALKAVGFDLEKEPEPNKQ